MQTDWEPWWPGLYSGAGAPTEYPGGSESYRMAGEYLAGEDLVEEWGCATTFGKQFIPAPYRGVDGGPSEFSDVQADLRTYQSDVPRALIRHVLEHNWEWRDILRNFLRSFEDRAAVILFIPMGQYDINRSFQHTAGLPPSPPGLQMDEASFWHIIRSKDIRVVKDVEIENETPPFDYERVIFLEKDYRVSGYFSEPPLCMGCGKVGLDQLRVDLTILGDRYEMAPNVCAKCALGAKQGLYSLDVIPDLTFVPNPAKEAPRVPQG